jgi:hypothetical protein
MLMQAAGTTAICGLLGRVLNLDLIRTAQTP